MIEYNPDRIRLARESEGYSQNQLAGHLKGVSQSKLNKIENRLALATDEIIEEIASFLGYPISFFKVQSGMTPYIKEYYYRRNLGINIKPKLAFEAQMTIIAENIDTLFDAIDMKVKLQYIDLEAEEISPKRVVEKIRSFFGIDSGPIRNVIETIQRMGVIINYFIPPFSIRIDGVSFITKKGIPVILINKNISNSRKVFTLCHELGHLIMHYKYMVSDKRDVEDEANIFASEFLMPEQQIKNQLYNLTFQKLFSLKAYWKVSIKALITRSRMLSCITKDQQSRWMMRYNANHWAQEEPYEFDMQEPTLLNRVFELYFSSLDYTEKELLDILHLTESKVSYYYDVPEIQNKFGRRKPRMQLMI